MLLGRGATAARPLAARARRLGRAGREPEYTVHQLL